MKRAVFLAYQNDYLTRINNYIRVRTHVQPLKIIDHDTKHFLERNLYLVAHKYVESHNHLKEEEYE